MLKKLALIILIGINNIQASDAPKTGFIQKIKNSSITAKVVGGILPCIATFISMEAVIRTNKDNPELPNIVSIAYYIKWISLIIATFFCDWLFKIDFKKWLLSCPKKDTSVVIGESHSSQEMCSGRNMLSAAEN
jgi:hypothetical protein